MNIEEMEWPLSKEELEYLYWDEKKTTYEIGDIFNKTKSSISYWMRKYNIKTRGGKKTTQEFKKEVYELVGDEYFLIGKYKNNYTKTKIKHNKCGYIYKVSPNNFLAGYRCPKCAGNLKKDTNNFKKEVQEIVGEKYSVLGEYINFHTKIKIKHNKCGYKYKVTPANFLNGRRCPRCAYKGLSKGEEKIQTILKDKNIEHKWQHKFKNCQNKLPLPFDFKIKNKPIVIEYNGRQHYESVSVFGGEERLKKQKKNDKIKKDFCKENNIKLITIPHWEKDNIEEILEEELKEVM